MFTVSCQFPEIPGYLFAVISFVPVSAPGPVHSIPGVDSIHERGFTTSVRTDQEHKPSCTGNIGDFDISEPLEIRKPDFLNFHQFFLY